MEPARTCGLLVGALILLAATACEDPLESRRARVEALLRRVPPMPPPAVPHPDPGVGGSDLGLEYGQRLDRELAAYGVPRHPSTVDWVRSRRPRLAALIAALPAAFDSSPRAASTPFLPDSLLLAHIALEGGDACLDHYQRLTWRWRIETRRGNVTALATVAEATERSVLVPSVCAREARVAPAEWVSLSETPLVGPSAVAIESTYSARDALAALSRGSSSRLEERLSLVDRWIRDAERCFDAHSSDRVAAASMCEPRLWLAHQLRLDVASWLSAASVLATHGGCTAVAEMPGPFGPGSARCQEAGPRWQVELVRERIPPALQAAMPERLRIEAPALEDPAQVP